ncbi:MAG: ribonuclease J [Chloroflexi bacterium]|nr:MAG: ribonuclease J [Phototrophicales bacterium]RMF77764.1 MAG: ribonuclease J [Chloroflexota bacterium]
MSEKLKIIPLGGLGEIGKNMTVFALGHDAFIIDTGIMFPANDMLGVDYIIPDFQYLRDRTDLKIHGVIFTHGHEDHTGAITHVIEAFPGTPIWATPLTAGLVEVKLRNAHLLGDTKINKFNAGDMIDLGPFMVESYHVCHSIPDCVGFGINTPYGLIVYSGDYKFDNTPIDGKKPDYAKLAEFSQRGVLMLMADSTNADQPGWTPSESIVTEAFDDAFKVARGRIIVATFASHISRIQQVANMARQYGRKLAIAGYSMTENVKMTRQMGLLDIPDEMLVDIGRIDDWPPEKIVIMATGSQGEPAAVLGRLATGRHRHLDVEVGDTIIVSAHTIPGNEEMVNRTINRLFQRGANVIYDPIAPVHVSGHARQEEMRLLINLVRPHYFLPIHGELRHLKEHAKLAIQSGISADNVFVVENGVVIEADEKGVRLGNRVPGGYVFVDGHGVGDVGPVVIRDREILARDGFLVVVADIDQQSGELLYTPEIITRGFIYLREADELLQQVKEVFTHVVEENHDESLNKLRSLAEESIRHFLYNETKRRPMTFCVINEH